MSSLHKQAGRPLQELTGQKFGRLTVIEKLPRIKNKRLKWRCQCDCGNYKEVTSKDLIGNRTKSCGCLQKELSSLRHRLDSGEASFNCIYRNYISKAKHRLIDFNLTKESFKQLVGLPCHYCGELPSNSSVKLSSSKYGDYLYNGIDRIDNTKGYTLENCVPCCTWCNTMKLNYTTEEFFFKCKRIVEFNNV